jgi:hypothetical protein
MLTRSLLAAALISCVAIACGGGAISVLHAKGRSSSSAAAVTVSNTSGATIDHLFIAKTEAVDKARQAGVAPGSPEDSDLWGEDQLGSADLSENSVFPISLPEGRYDVLVVDKDRREELVKGLKLAAGRKYVLDVGTDWQLAR